MFIVVRESLSLICQSTSWMQTCLSYTAAGPSPTCCQTSTFLRSLYATQPDFLRTVEVVSFSGWIIYSPLRYFFPQLVVNALTFARRYVSGIRKRFVQWLNYSKVGGGTLHFFPPFNSLLFLSPFLSSLPMPPIPLEIGRPPSS